MADGPQSGTLQDDELDFRPLAGQSAPGKPVAQARPAAASDDIDFQAASATAKPQRPASPAPAGDIDFQPAAKSASKLRTPTLDELSTGRPAGTQTPSLTERGARAGEPMVHLGRPDNFFVDATKSARNVFTNEFQHPGMRTQE